MNLKALWGGFLKFIIEKIGAERIGRRKNYTLDTFENFKPVSKSGHFKVLFMEPKPLTKDELEEFRDHLPKELKEEMQKIINLYERVTNPKPIEDLR